jgi:deoxyribonuclease-4
MLYGEMAERIKKIGHVHSHFSGIEYTEKGERRHIMTPESEAGELIGALLKSKVDARIINESPEPIGDAEMMKRVMEKMRGEALMGHHKPQRGALS